MKLPKTGGRFYRQPDGQLLPEENEPAAPVAEPQPEPESDAGDFSFSDED